MELAEPRTPRTQSLRQRRKRTAHPGFSRLLRMLCILRVFFSFLRGRGPVLPGRRMIWQTSRFSHRPGRAAGDGHRQRHADSVCRRRPAPGTDSALRLRGAPAEGRGCCSTSGRIHPPWQATAAAGRRAGAQARCCAAPPQLGVPVSVPTKAEVMQAALDPGRRRRQRHLALSRPARHCQFVARHPSCGVCLMHMHDRATMQTAPMDWRRAPGALQFRACGAPGLQALGVENTASWWIRH